LKTIRNIITTFIVLANAMNTMAQETVAADTLAAEKLRRPHILYVEAMGRGGYWSVGYGYSFFQRKKHELNGTIGMNFMWYGKYHQSTAIPVGVFYRYGERFKVEVGFSALTLINWAKFYQKSYYDSTEGHIVEIPSHKLAVAPSIGFVYGSKNKKIELGLRYSPLFNVYNKSDMLPVWFGAFFNYRLKRRRK